MADRPEFFEQGNFMNVFDLLNKLIQKQNTNTQAISNCFEGAERHSQAKGKSQKVPVSHMVGPSLFTGLPQGKRAQNNNSGR